MKYGNYRDGFFLPNELFQLGLDYGELAVYSFLKRCENRKTHQCWPSIKTIGEAVGMSENTVRKYIRQLEERGLITTEPTEVITKSSGRRNGNLLFTLRPIGEVIDQHYRCPCRRHRCGSRVSPKPASESPGPAGRQCLPSPPRPWRCRCGRTRQWGWDRS